METYSTEHLNAIFASTPPGWATLLVLSDSRPVSALTLSELFRRICHRVGFGVRAHKFRHTYATEYLRQGGEIERLRRILGHST